MKRNLALFESFFIIYLYPFGMNFIFYLDIVENVQNHGL